MEERCGITNLAPLDTVPVGARAKVKMLVSDGSVRRRLLDLGLIPDTEVEALLKSPSGDPTAYRFRGAVIALRSDVAHKIMVEIGSQIGSEYKYGTWQSERGRSGSRAGRKRRTGGRGLRGGAGRQPQCGKKHSI